MIALGISGLLLGVATLALGATPPPAYQLPTIDLGYTLQKATVYNKSGDYYSFKNIRYAAPPTGQNRFRGPQPPAVNRSVSDGSTDRMCPQASTAWLKISNEFAPAYLAGNKSNVTQQELDQLNATVPLPARGPTETEDCLFLDVSVPKHIFENAGKIKDAPVLVWIYGGGYSTGSKSFYDPYGLIKRSNKSIIYVAINYRLGALGWSAGPDFSKTGTPNAGLYDQLAALRWVQKYISNFGGDPSQVTVMGESAGAGSVTHQLTAFGGKKTPPFQQVIPQSPAYPIISDPHAMNVNYEQLLRTAGVKDMTGLRALSEDDMIQANVAQIWHAVYATNVYAPSVDGVFVPDTPGKLFLQGRFNKQVNVMAGHNGNEAILFTDPFINSTASLAAYLQSIFPTINNAQLKYITKTLYPPPPYHNGSLSYTDETGRASQLLAEFGFTCNTNYIERAYKRRGYGYYFNIPPATHGMDVAYTFWDGVSTLDNTTVAAALQDYIVTFVKHGQPQTRVKGIPPFEPYGNSSTVQELEPQRIGPGRDTTANGRCLWWQQAYYENKT